MLRKPKPLYSKLVISNENRKLKLDFNAVVNPRQYVEGNGLIISPYSEYIPLLYLLCTSSSSYGLESSPSQTIFKTLKENLNGYTDWSRKYGGTLFYNLAYNAYQTDKKEYILRLQERMKEWIYSDYMIQLSDIFSLKNTYGTDRESTIRNINTFTRRMHQRSYNCWNSVFTSFLQGPNDPVTYASEQYYPELLAVILPENYLYMKYNLLVHNTIDLSKVIILVDRELNTAQFEKKAYRKFYQEAFLPHIMKSACDVWEVPKEFITENCFLGDVSFKGMGPIKKREIVDDMINQFCEDFVNKYGEGKEADISMNVYAVPSGDDGIFEQIRNYPLSYTYTIGSLTPTQIEIPEEPMDEEEFEEWEDDSLNPEEMEHAETASEPF